MTSPSENDRVTFRKTPRGIAALDHVLKETGQSLTEAYNHAMVIYSRLLRETAAREKGAQKGDIIVYMANPENPGQADKVYLT